MARPDDALMLSLLTISDVMGTRHHSLFYKKARPSAEDPRLLEGRIKPGRVFDRPVGLEAVPDGYRAMDNPESIKVIVQP
jgi:threonine dehydrogenase-like Zn-dependent dehydrogenase